MPKIYYNSTGGKYEVAKVTLGNYKKVEEWILAESLKASITKTTDSEGLTIRVIQDTPIGSKEKIIDIYEGSDACYISRSMASNSLDICSEDIVKECDWRPEHYLMQLFQYKELPEHLQAISKPICELAEHLDSILPNNPEKTTALRKLRECKDCAVTATIFK